jgi:PEP-CTERM motif-containing protein
MGPTARIALLVVSLSLASSPAHADLIVWHLQGTIEEIHEGSLLEAKGLIDLGSVLDAEIIVDTAAPDLCDVAGHGLYILPSATWQVNGNTYTATSFPGNPGVVAEVDNPLGVCPVNPDTNPVSSLTVRAFGGGMVSPMVLTFGWSALLIGESLPGELLLPPDFATVSSCFLCEQDAELLAFVTVEPIPEPSTLTFLVIGLAGVARRLTQRSHS